MWLVDADKLDREANASGEYQIDAEGEPVVPARLAASGKAHNDAFLSRSALPMTETELNVMAALAIIGLSSRPSHG